MLAPSMTIPAAITIPMERTKNIPTRPAAATMAAGRATFSLPRLSMTRPKATLTALAARSTTPSTRA